MMDKILIVGRVPPPIGGVTTFVLRQKQLLKDSGNVVELFPLLNIKDFITLLKIMVHFYDKYQVNTISLPLLLFLFFSGNLKKTEVIDHNHSRHFNKDLKSKLKLCLLNFTEKVSLVDEHLKGNYPNKFKKHSVITPFLPPTKQEINNASNCIPTIVQNLISNTNKIIVVSAWRCIEENGKDLYGLEESIICFLSLETKMKNVGLVICIGDSSYNTRKIEKLNSLARKSNKIVFWRDCNASWTLFTENTLYLRPTSTDGNSISVHEALFFKSKVLASDVVDRPLGCMTYQYENVKDLQTKILKSIE